MTMMCFDIQLEIHYTSPITIQRRLTTRLDFHGPGPGTSLVLHSFNLCSPITGQSVLMVQEEADIKMDPPADQIPLSEKMDKVEVDKTEMDDTKINKTDSISTSPALRRRRRTGSPEALSRRNTISASSVPPKPFCPTVVLDGSKLILRLARNDTFVIDNPCKILLATPHVRLERPVAWQTNVTCTEPENTVVIDCGLLGHRFVPVPLAHYGTVYTKDGTIHVTVGSTVRRAKVHSRNLPYRTCNKFHCVSILESETEEEETAASASGWFMERQSTNNALASIDPAQAVKLIKQLASDPQAGVVYIRADDSIIRYKLGHDEKIELHSGRIVAWTVGVRFEQTNYCCFRFVTAVHGEGTVWIQNSRPRGVPSGI